MAKKTYTDDDLGQMLLAASDVASRYGDLALASGLRYEAELIGTDLDPGEGLQFDDLEGWAADPGIDYSYGRSNVDEEFNIHYGIIPEYAVTQAWSDAEAIYGDFEIECPECDVVIETVDGVGPDECPECGADVSAEFQGGYEYSEPIGFRYDQEGYEASQNAGDRDIIILKAPFYTYAQFCSPCAPGAGYVLNWLKEPVETNKTFCFGHDWFDEGAAPYPVFSIITNERVYPPDVAGRPTEQDLIEALHVTADLAEEVGRHQLAKKLRKAL